MTSWHAEPDACVAVQIDTLVLAAKQSLLCQVAFVAPLTGDARLRKRIEGAIAAHPKADEVTGSLLPADIRYVARSASEKPATITISCPAPIEGLPERLHV